MCTQTGKEIFVEEKNDVQYIINDVCVQGQMFARNINLGCGRKTFNVINEYLAAGKYKQRAFSNQ